MTAKVLLFLHLALSAAYAQNQTTDYPPAQDWTTVTRPAGYIITGASHVDMDEYKVPLGRYYNSQFGKTATVTGAIDYLAYSGPPTISTLQNLNDISYQLVAKGYKQVFTCVREQCNAAAFSTAIRDPIMKVMGGTGYYNITLDSLGAASADMRYAAFQKDNEYLCVMTVLNPGRHSGILLVDVGGKNPVPSTSTATPPKTTKPGPIPVRPNRP